MLQHRGVVSGDREVRDGSRCTRVSRQAGADVSVLSLQSNNKAGPLIPRQKRQLHSAVHVLQVSHAICQ